METRRGVFAPAATDSKSIAVAVVCSSVTSPSARVVLVAAAWRFSVLRHLQSAASAWACLRMSWTVSRDMSSGKRNCSLYLLGMSSEYVPTASTGT